MRCKFVERNNKENKCHDYYLHHGREARCRLMEWKQKKGVCPYDRTIQSQKNIRDKRQFVLFTEEEEEKKEEDKADRGSQENS
jgi:hypothetical protein